MGTAAWRAAKLGHMGSAKFEDWWEFAGVEGSPEVRCFFVVVAVIVAAVVVVFAVVVDFVVLVLLPWLVLVLLVPLLPCCCCCVNSCFLRCLLLRSLRRALIYLQRSVPTLCALCSPPFIGRVVPSHFIVYRRIRCSRRDTAASPPFTQLNSPFVPLTCADSCCLVATRADLS